jgi:hypothetical protein
VYRCGKYVQLMLISTQQACPIRRGPKGLEHSPRSLGGRWLGSGGWSVRGRAVAVQTDPERGPVVVAKAHPARAVGLRDLCGRQGRCGGGGCGRGYRQWPGIRNPRRIRARCRGTAGRGEARPDRALDRFAGRCPGRPSSACSRRVCSVSSGTRRPYPGTHRPCSGARRPAEALFRAGTGRRCGRGRPDGCRRSFWCAQEGGDR